MFFSPSAVSAYTLPRGGDDERRFLALPKSITLQRSSASTRMLCGPKSQWKTPRPCIHSRKVKRPPAWLVASLLDGRTQFPTDYPSGVRCRNLRTDVDWLKGAIRRENDSVRYPGLGEILGDTLRMLDPREHWDTLSLSDPAPGLGSSSKRRTSWPGCARWFLLPASTCYVFWVARCRRSASRQRSSRAADDLP